MLGTGNDTFIWNNGDGSDVVDGQAGFDTLVFNGADVQERITISANGDHATLARDLGNVTMDLNRIEQIDVNPLGGPDTIIVGDLTGTGVRQVAIDLAAVPGTAPGDDQADIVSVSGTNGGGDHITLTGNGGNIQINGLPEMVSINGIDGRIDILNVHGQGGDDTIDASGLNAHIVLTLDGGDGNDVIHGSDFACNIVGGAGNDTLIGGAGDAHISGNDGDDIIMGGAGQNVIDGGSGDDQITSFGGPDFLQGGAGNDIIHAGAGEDTVEGDSGNDTLFGDAGDDTFLWSNGDGSDTDDGGTGTDTLVFNASGADEQFAISANGTHVSLTRDVGNVAMDLNDFEHLIVNTSGGADTVTVNDLTGTGVLRTEIDLGQGSGGAGGDGANDTVVINGTAGNDTFTLSIVNGVLHIAGLSTEVTVAHFDANDTIHINGLGGDDVFDTTGIGPNGPKIVIDGGDGNDTLTGPATEVANVETINSGFHLV